MRYLHGYKRLCNSKSMMMAAAIALVSCQSNIEFDDDCSDGTCEDVTTQNKIYQKNNLVLGLLSVDGNDYFIQYENSNARSYNQGSNEYHSELSTSEDVNRPVYEIVTSYPSASSMMEMHDLSRSINLATGEIRESIEETIKNFVLDGIYSVAITNNIKEDDKLLETPFVSKTMPPEFSELLTLLTDEMFKSEIDNIDIENNPCTAKDQQQTDSGNIAVKIDIIDNNNQTISHHPPRSLRTKVLNGENVFSRIEYCPKNLSSYAELKIALANLNEKTHEVLVNN